MAQLTDDCFAFSGPLLPVDEVERIIRERVVPVAEIERVPLNAANGRVVARDVAAPIDLPPFDNSAVDGYAVRHADLAAKRETQLVVAERVTAGRAARHALRAGEAVRIFTGAPMPSGADTVFMQEDVRADEKTVTVPPGLKPGANRRLKGEDVRAGSVVLPAGRRLAAQDVALAAAVGLTALDVFRRVRVAVFSTGDEIVEPGTPRPAPALFDANRYLLVGLIERLGGEPTDLGILPDDPERLARAIAGAAENHDLVLTSGGVSTGEADHVRNAVEDVGRLVFWRVAIKPGRPVAMGVIPGSQRGAGAAFVGLPGNPAAVYVTFARVVRPLLMRLAGVTAAPLVALPVRAAFGYRKKAGRREYVRVKLVRAADGAIEAVKHAQEGAGIITSLTETDGLVELPEDATTVEPGSTVGFLSYAALAG
ncbi:MAG TPA: gephyrin-like molybdotransferase Glp [Xanthobacteraceae bacterium]|nr:gephyrin-like molybdotransferase Glp [Xanthobacteraceae bacterium]